MQDTGVGIAEADRALIFDDYGQSRGGQTPEQEGTVAELVLRNGQYYWHQRPADDADVAYQQYREETHGMTAGDRAATPDSRLLGPPAPEATARPKPSPNPGAFGRGIWLLGLDLNQQPSG